MAFNIKSVSVQLLDGEVRSTSALDLSHFTEDGRNLIAQEVADEPAATAERVIYDAALAYAGLKGKPLAAITSTELAEKLPEGVLTTASGLGDIMDLVVAYATDADGDGVPATALTVEQIVAELEQILSFQDIMGQVKSALKTGSNAGLTRSLLLATARYARVNGSATLSDQVADGLTYALDALSRSLLDEAAATLGTTAPNTITETDIDNALGRV